MRKRVTNQVTQILRDNVIARNDDRELLILYMQEFGLDLNARQIDLFREMPSTETIRRTRQMLQEQGKYPASPEVEEARYQKFKEVRANIKEEDPEALLEKRGYRIVTAEEEREHAKQFQTD